MGFAIDLVDFGGEKMPGLKIALCKRIYAGVNNMLSTISSMKSSAKLAVHKNELFSLRQDVLDLRFKLNQQEK